MLKILFCVFFVLHGVSSQNFPLVINTWPFSHATQAGLFITAWESLQSGGSRLDAVVEGCSQCEFNYRSCDSSVGWGGSPDETGETTLDAMVMDGPSHDVGAVGCLRGIQSAIGVARAVLEYTKHTLLVGQLATDFAREMGFPQFNLSSEDSVRAWENWKDRNCQPNYRQNVSPDPTEHCGPYTPNPTPIQQQQQSNYLKFMPRENTKQRSKKHGSFKTVSGVVEKSRENRMRSSRNGLFKNGPIPGQFGRDPAEGHDTIAMIVVDGDGNFASGTSTNGAGNKVPGRVGDSPIVGAGSYVDNEVGGAGATGDGDIMVRFLPSLRVVEMMRSGMDPVSAIKEMLNIINRAYPGYAGAMVAVNKDGDYGGACLGFAWFRYSVVSASTGEVEIHDVDCPTP